MEQIKFVFKRDNYKTKRGGHSNFLNLYCDHCGNYLLTYQKDGPGPLKRLYLDRIFAPKEIYELQYTKDIKDVSELRCVHCNKLIGIPSIFEKENRKVFLLLSYAFIKKITKGIYPPLIKKVETQ